MAPRERTCAKRGRSNAAMMRLPETLGSFGIRRVDGERRQDRRSNGKRLLLFLQVEPGRLLEIGDRFLERLALARGAQFRSFGDVEIALAMDHGAQGHQGHLGSSIERTGLRFSTTPPLRFAQPSSPRPLPSV